MAATFHHPRAARLKTPTARGVGESREKKQVALKKKCLTNSQECAIIKAQRGKQGRSQRQDPRESGKSLTIKSSTARCSCVRDTNVNQTPQAEKMLGIRRIQKPFPFCGARLMVRHLLSKRRMGVRLHRITPIKKSLDKWPRVWYNKDTKTKGELELCL